MLVAFIHDTRAAPADVAPVERHSPVVHRGDRESISKDCYHGVGSSGRVREDPDQRGSARCT